jgi:hypothetical protein
MVTSISNKLIRCCLTGCVIVFMGLISGCQLGQSFFQMDSDSSVPRFGVNLIPSKSFWSARGTSYHPPRKDAPQPKHDDRDDEVIDLAPAPVKSKRTGLFVSQPVVKK